MNLVPLAALAARADRAADIVAPQYDSIPAGGRYAYAVGRPDCFLNVTLSVADFPEPAPGRAAVAARAAGCFEAMMERGLFEAVPGPAFFLYELDTGSRRQAGIVVGMPVAAVEEGRILGHEGTIEERVDDLALFFRTARLASSPVALAFRPDEGLRRLMERLASRPPLRDFSGPDGVRQRLWAVADPSDTAAVEEAAARIGTLYITDGHHRVAASLREGASPGWFLAVLYPADHLRALEYNRYVRLDQVPPFDRVRPMLGEDWETAELGPDAGPGARPGAAGDVSMLLGGVWRRLRYRGARAADPVERLDVSLLHDRILAPVFGVSSYEDPRLSYVAGGQAAMRLEELAAEYPGAGFALYPPSIEEMMAVSDAGRTMPPKSTWFTPKPRSGLLVAPWEPPSGAGGGGTV